MPRFGRCCNSQRANLGIALFSSRLSSFVSRLSSHLTSSRLFSSHLISSSSLLPRCLTLWGLHLSLHLSCVHHAWKLENVDEGSDEGERSGKRRENLDERSEEGREKSEYRASANSPPGRRCRCRTASPTRTRRSQSCCSRSCSAGAAGETA